MKMYKNVKIIKAQRFHERFIGNMFKKNIKNGLLFDKCRAIHTFFMLDNIDVIATDNNDKIIKTYKNVKPWRIIIAPSNVTKIYELPKNTI